MPVLRRAKALIQSTTRKEPPRDAPSGTEGFRALGKAAEVPSGGMKAFDAGDRPIAVANVGGTYYAFDDVCTHRRCPLSDGELEGTHLTCICHGSRFDISSGALLRGPAQRPITTYPVQVDGEDLKVQV